MFFSRQSSKCTLKQLVLATRLFLYSLFVSLVQILNCQITRGGHVDEHLHSLCVTVTSVSVTVWRVLIKCKVKTYWFKQRGFFWLNFRGEKEHY